MKTDEPEAKSIVVSIDAASPMEGAVAAKKTLTMRIATLDRHKTFQNRKVVMFVRNAERVDRVFPEWLHTNITDTGEYLPDDLNLPPTMFARPEGPQGYVDDSPITEIGTLNAQMIGRAIRLHDVWPLTKIVCSPALRCVQTANAIIKGLNKAIPICVEPALFDWSHWYNALPSLLPNDELLRCGFPVDVNYVPLKSLEDIAAFISNESIEHFYGRIRSAVDRLINVPTADRILIVAHATVLDAGVKALRRCSPRLVTENDMLHMGTHYPYASCATLAQHQGNWSFVHEPISQLSYLGISNRINAKFVNRTTKTKDIVVKRTPEVVDSKKANVAA